MNRINAAPVVASGLSGLVIGVLLTLGVTRAMLPNTTKSLPTVAAPTPVVSRPRHLDAVIWRLVVARLGPAVPNPKISRLVNIFPLPADAVPGPVHVTRPRRPSYKSLDIIFRLNDHPLGKSWRLRAAKGDVFRVLKGLYTSGLPIADVRMDGEFPLGTGGARRESTAVVIYMSRATAAHIAWKRIDRSSESQVWKALNYARVDPRFA